MTSIDLTIGKVARAAGVGVETVRFYERKELVQRPRKPERGFRVYSPEIVTRIRFIRAAQGLGFSLREVSELLSLRADTAADAGSVRAQVETKLRDVDDRIRRLRNTRTALRQLFEGCSGDGPIQACSILDALDFMSEKSE